MYHIFQYILEFAPLQYPPLRILPLQFPLLHPYFLASFQSPHLIFQGCLPVPDINIKLLTRNTKDVERELTVNLNEAYI